MERRWRAGEAMRVGPRVQQTGFTYLGLLAAIVILGLLLSVAGHVWSFSLQREKEQQLLYIGDQYRKAIGSYYSLGSAYPLTLQDLLSDQRTPVPRHHLRQLYRDPLTNDTDWILVKDPTGVGIMGVASRSALTPIKRLRFADIEVGFANKDCYCDWKFIYSPPNFFDHRYGVPGQGQFGLGPNPSPTVTVPVNPSASSPTQGSSSSATSPTFTTPSPNPNPNPYPLRPFRP
jgi:type II secretory pathway pseudopilin PulG